MTKSKQADSIWLIRDYVRGWLVAFYVIDDREAVAMKKAEAKIEFLKACSWDDFKEYVVPGSQRDAKRVLPPNSAHVVKD